MTSPAPAPPVPLFLHRPWVIVAAVSLFSILLTLVTQRGGVRLSFDSFYYVEYAKAFRHQPPDSFGQSWPYGWPLIGAAGGLVGLGAYATLVTAAAASVLVLIALSARLLLDDGASPGRVWLLLLTGAAGFLLTVLVSGVFSEVPFAAVLLGLVFCFTRWPHPGAIMASGVLALAALSLRYAGGLALLLVVGWVWWDRRNLRPAGRLPLALGTVVAACLAGALLLLWNRQVTGHFSGAESRGSVPPGEWLGIAADLGWAWPTAFGGLFLRDLLGFDGLLRLPAGLLLLALALFAGAVASLKGCTRADRALGALIVTYLLGMVILRCHSFFDALHNGRTVFPVLFPLLIVVARLPLPRALPNMACLLVVGLNIALCVRGASLAVAADVRATVPLVQETRWPDHIMVNEAARSLSALVDAPVRRLVSAPLFASEQRSPSSPPAHIVYAAVPAGRGGQPAPLSAEEQLEINGWLDRGYRAVLSDPSLVVLQYREGSR